MTGIVSAFGIFLLRQYMTSIPDELLDAARIDGANEFSIYARVVTRGPRSEALLPYLQDWDSDLILRTTAGVPAGARRSGPVRPQPSRAGPGRRAARVGRPGVGLPRQPEVHRDSG